ncbi:heparinase II/III family protein [Croceibacterium aestuarii]|uniref:heparinase II/III family protein n=1 Tax=Croceibacterium aestuarii TaxID=3064139 RepID=UPI00272E9763|nr:heparinase II/III family protein [Croceibacterium sp. D39]
MSDRAVQAMLPLGVEELDAEPADEGGDAMAIPLSATEEEPLAAGVEEEAIPPAPSELIEPGRALVISDFVPPEVSAGERLIRLAYRLGIPGSALAAPFRKHPAPRLLATVENPLPGDPVAGTALRAGHFIVHGVKTPIAHLDCSPVARLTPPLERVVHGFTWLADLEACAPRQQCTQTAERVLAAWLEANPKPGKGAAWRVGHAGQRLLGWLVHAPLLLGGNAKRLRARTLAAAVETARWLDRNVSKADDRLAEVAGWCGIVAAGLLLPEGKPRRLFGEAGLVRALGDLVGDDGGVLSRSPLDQMEAIALLTRLTACYRATRRDPPQAIDAMLRMLVPPLLAMIHADGALGSWQGSSAVGEDRLRALIAASGVRTRPLKDARQWGYQRVTAGRSTLLLDAAPPPLARHSRHGCASTLAFELSHGPNRIVVNCGGAATAGGLVPVRIEQGLRATAAHSTLVLGDSNSTAVLINGKLGSGVTEVEVDRRLAEAGKSQATRIEASHDGYVSRLGLVHRRILILRDDGTELRGEDLLVPAGKKGKRGKVPYAIRFHLGPAVEASLTDTGRGAHLALRDGTYWQFLAPRSEVTIDESLWIDGEGRPHPVQQLVIEGMESRGGGSFAWLFKKIGQFE